MEQQGNPGSAGGPRDYERSSRIWGRMDAEDESILPLLPSVSDYGLGRDANTEHRVPSSSTTDNTNSAQLKGKAMATDQELSPAGPNHLCALPPELIDNILTYLSVVDVNSLSAASRLLRRHAMSEFIWQRLVQANVPGVKVTSPAPCPTFRALFAAHDPRWFLTKHKIWFSGRDLVGKLVVARYDPRRGCIDGYQLLATSNPSTYRHLDVGGETIIIHSFEPSVKLHLDMPVLQLHADRPSNPICPEHGPAITHIPLRSALPTPPSSRSNSEASPATPSSHGRFQVETSMVPHDLARNPVVAASLMLARPLSPDEVTARATLPFPYGGVWPPPAVPARHRVGKVKPRSADLAAPPGATDGPTCRSEVSDSAFRIRTWLEMREGGGPIQAVEGLGIHWLPILQTLRRQYRIEGQVGGRMGEEITTYSTLDPELYTPTPEKPYRGIWVGDYSGHGCEFLLINQPEEARGSFDPESLVQEDNETEEEFRRRKYDKTVHRGRLEAIKLTGDDNVPRGEYTFVAEDLGDDLGDSSSITAAQEAPFKGAKVVRSKGHVAGSGFVNDTYIESQLILISHDRLAQYWVDFGHISFFERVDIDQFLQPE